MQSKGWKNWGRYQNIKKSFYNRPKYQRPDPSEAPATPPPKSRLRGSVRRLMELEQAMTKNILLAACHLAVLDMNAADGIAEQYPDIETWYIGGHSLGGAMAAIYAAGHSDELDGLILLAAYSTKDLSSSDLAVLSVYGSEDRVLNAEKYETSKANLPASMTEVIIEGGCHAGFGAYGPQAGDGTPSISNEEQIDKTAEEIQAIISKIP